MGSGLTDLSPASVITLPDEKLSFPHNWFRKPHGRRFAVVVSNARLCSDHVVRTLVAIPMTSDVSAKEATEVLIKRSAENGLECDSLAMVHLIQPVAKSDVRGKVGVLNARDWEALEAALGWMIERD